MNTSRINHPVEARIPPAARSAVEILRRKGHVVTVRQNRLGSFRYAVDGRPETDALTMVNRFRRYGL